MTSVVQGWSNGTIANNGFIFATSESNNYGYKRFSSGETTTPLSPPTLYVTYENCTNFTSAATGTHKVCGAIRDKYLAAGGPTGPLGYPTTDETPTPDGAGRFNHFASHAAQGNGTADGSIYWHPSVGSGPYIVTGPIRAAWASWAWERGPLGYPTSDQFAGDPTQMNTFEGGYVMLDPATNTGIPGTGNYLHPSTYQRVTQKRVQLQSQTLDPSKLTVPQGYHWQLTGYWWRPNNQANLDPGPLNQSPPAPQNGWVSVPASSMQTAAGGSVTFPLPLTTDPVNNKMVDSPSLNWNAAAVVPTDGAFQLLACFNNADVQGASNWCRPVTLFMDRAGLTGANATAPVGPGSVGMLTGAYTVGGPDISTDGAAGPLGFSRTFISTDPTGADSTINHFMGPGWRQPRRQTTAITKRSSIPAPPP